MAVYYMYVLLCADGTLYTGSTDNLVRRLRAHNSGRGAKYTRSRRPVRLVWWEKYPSKAQAMRREALVKGWSREQKLRLLPGEVLAAEAAGRAAPPAASGSDSDCIDRTKGRLP